MNFPVLSIITFTPMVAALIMLMMPSHRRNETRAVALASAAFALILSIWVYFSYDQAAAGYQFVEKYNWLPALGISLHFGVDGMSTPLVLLTGVVMFTGVLISWGDEDPHVKAGIQDRPREFFAFLFILASGVFGVFVSLDLFMLFFFYEIAVFPMYLLIAIWGWVKTREYAAMKLTLYLFIGSVVALVGALAMYWVSYQNTGVLTFDMLALEKAGFSQTFQYIWFLPVFLGFAVLGGIWPFHNWSPDGHVAAPTAVSMFHAGVLMKLGAFAALRVGIMLLPEGAKQWSWLIMIFAGIAVVYGAYIAFVQMDLKYMIGFSSVSHMGLVMLGFSTLKSTGIDRRWRTNVLTRCDDSSLLCHHRYDLRSFAYPPDPRTGRYGQSYAICHGRFHHRWFGFDGYAGLFRFCSRIPDLYGCVEQPMAGCCDRQHFHCHHRGIYHA